jgi:outer membrane protein TolC
MLKFVSLAYLAVLISFSFARAESVELKNLVNEALSNSPNIQKTKAAYDEAAWKKTETLQGFLPSLTGSLNYLTQKRYMLVDINLNGAPASIAQVIPTTLYTLTASLPLFDGLASTNRFWAGQNLEHSAKHEFDWAQFSIQRTVILQFYKTLAAQSLKEVSEQNLKTLVDHLKDAQALKKAGVATSYDVLRVEVQVSEAKSEVLSTRDNYEMSRFKLGEILGKDYESRELLGSWPSLSIQAINQIKNLKIENRLDLVGLKEKVQALRDLDTAAGRYWAPKVAAFGQYQYYNNINDHFSDSEKFREAYQVGLSLTWNLFDGMTSIAKAHQASAQALQLESSLKMSELKAQQDFEFWKRKFNYFKTVYDSRVVDVEKSTEAIRLAKEGRRAGTRTSTDLLDAELDLFRSRAGQVNSQIGVIEALINLELTTGQTIYEFN